MCAVTNLRVTGDRHVPFQIVPRLIKCNTVVLTQQPSCHNRQGLGLGKHIHESIRSGSESMDPKAATKSNTAPMHTQKRRVTANRQARQAQQTSELIQKPSSPPTALCCHSAEPESKTREQKRALSSSCDSERQRGAHDSNCVHLAVAGQCHAGTVTYNISKEAYAHQPNR
jgi:hypothetical protein